MQVSNHIIDVLIPAFNEENAVGKVIDEIPPIVRNIIVCNNASRDNTSRNALEKGAIVVEEDRKGYGYACLRAMKYIEEHEKLTPPDIIVFLDADYSDYPEEIPSLVEPIINGEKDLIIGSRALGNSERGSMTPPQIFGNWLATTLIKMLYGYEFTDLGPFRAIKYKKLLELQMNDKTFGWTVEMQVKSAKLGFRCGEIPVRYRKRIGKSKVSGTIKGTILAGHKILWTIFKLY